MFSYVVILKKKCFICIFISYRASLLTCQYTSRIIVKATQRCSQVHKGSPQQLAPLVCWMSFLMQT